MRVMIANRPLQTLCHPWSACYPACSCLKAIVKENGDDYK